LPQAVGQRVVIELRHLHDGGVWFEGDAGPGLAAGAACLGERPFGNAARVLLLPGETGTGFAVGCQISSSSFSESAFTTLTPTPCKPPDTL